MSKLVIAPLEVLTSKALTEPERKVLLVLYSFRGRNTENVYPGIDSIADRAGYTDKTRISKLTSSLARKGWLEKRKKGFTGCNNYRLMIPESETEDSNLAPEANLDQEANPNLDSEANSNLAPEANCKEQTIEQTSSNNKRIDGLDFSGWPEIPEKQVWSDYKKLRSQKKAPISQTVINRMATQLVELSGLGVSVNEALCEQMERGWTGLKAEWVIKSIRGNQHEKHQQPNPQPRENALRRVERQAREVFAAAEAEEAGISNVGPDEPAFWSSLDQSGGGDNEP